MDDQTLCKEIHKNIDAKLDVHDKRLDNHGERLDKMENNQIRAEVMIQNLCEQIKALVGIIKTVFLGGGGTLIVLGLGFIIWYIQTH